MNRSIRKLVGIGTAALAIGVFFALMAVQLAGASSGSHQSLANAGVANIITHLRTEQTADIVKKAVPEVHPAVTPSASCSTAKANLAADIAKDKVEDATERTNAKSDPNFKASDVAEDKAERAARKSLVDAVRAACGPTKPAPSAQCTAALQSLKAALVADRAEDQAEKSAGTEGTAADATEDKAERAQIVNLWQAVRTSCGFGTNPGHLSTFGSSGTWTFKH